MSKFFIKYKDGSEANIDAKVTYGDAVSAELTDILDFKCAEYIEFPLHSDEICAGDEGYFLVQAGNGKCANRDYGISFYKERENCELVLRDCFMPVFGIKHNDKCYIAVVTGMATDISQVIKIEDNRYYLKVRFEVDGIVPYENIRLEFYNIDKADAEYSDMARAYREYQLRHGFKPIKERLTPELEYSVESVNVRIRLGWKPVPCEIPEQTEENEPDVYTACTFDDVIKVMEAYKKAGIEKAEFCLVGWNMKGHDGRWPQILPVESSFGGEEGLKRLIDTAKCLGYAITCHTNSTDMYSISNRFNVDDIAIMRNGEKSVEAVRWGGGRTYNICPKRAYEISMETLPEVAELGFRGMHYIDVVTCTPPRECSSSKHLINKKESGDYFDKLFKKTIGMFGSVGSEGAYDYYLKNCDYTLYVSFADYTDNSSRFELCDKIIPFWQLVYHGIVASNPYARTVNYALSDDRDDMLKVVEFGGKPQMYYYAKFVSDGTDWIGSGDFRCNTNEEIEYSASKAKEIVDAYNEIKYLQYEFMEDHKETEPNVFEIKYSDGSVVTVDYNNKTYTLKRGRSK
ncbi:MAG: DUF5696 domain-containing protein [Monoglobaceae bacterium]